MGLWLRLGCIPVRITIRTAQSGLDRTTDEHRLCNQLSWPFVLELGGAKLKVLETLVLYLVEVSHF